VTRTKPKGLAPGKALEMEVLDLLRAAGFRTHYNAGAAKPRQTDIVAQGNDLHLLVEVKDRKRAVDIGDIDSLRSRLERTTRDVIGLIFTTASITRGAIKEIENDRTRETLVFVSTEMELLRACKARLLNLIAKKRSELRINGHAWFRRCEEGEYLNVVLPKSTLEFIANSPETGYFSSKTNFAHAALALDIPDTGWGNSGGEGVRLGLSLSLSTLDEFQDLLGYLHDSFGLSSNGSFTIHQSGECWHGSGVRNLLKAAEDPWQRYRAAEMSRVHHSEDLLYFDQLRNGWVSLYTRQRVPDDDRPGSHSFMHETHVCVQLPGVPVDQAPYIDLCRYTGNEWADFRVVHERRTQTRRLRKPIKLDVLGTVVRTDDNREDDRWIVGLVARNPFYRKKKLPRDLEIEGSPLHDLLEMELILCGLRDHIQEGDQVDEYHLEGVETTEGQDFQVIRPFGTWNKLVKRVRGEPLRPEVDIDLTGLGLKPVPRLKRSYRRLRRKK
jgi:hypothetical protein